MTDKNLPKELVDKINGDKFTLATVCDLINYPGNIIYIETDRLSVERTKTNKLDLHLTLKEIPRETQFHIRRGLNSLGYKTIESEAQQNSSIIIVKNPDLRLLEKIEFAGKKDLFSKTYSLDKNKPQNSFQIPKT